MALLSLECQFQDGRHRDTTFFTQSCEAPSRQAKASVLEIGRPRNCFNKCVSGGRSPKRNAAIELNVSQCCAISDWHSDDSNPANVATREIFHIPPCSTSKLLEQTADSFDFSEFVEYSIYSKKLLIEL